MFGIMYIHIRLEKKINAASTCRLLGWKANLVRKGQRLHVLRRGRTAARSASGGGGSSSKGSFSTKSAAPSIRFTT